jgi:hypothetical protein
MSADPHSAAVGVSLFDADWHQGVVGIVAARIKERLHRPVFAFARGEGDGGEIKGSGRSVPGLHLRDALDLVGKRAPGLLLRFGGHAMAAGVTIRECDLPRFRELFAQVAEELLAPADRTRTLETDGGLESGYYSIATARLLEAEVWGQGFPAPLFEDEFVVESQRILKDKHLKLRLRKGAQRLDAIQFNFSHTPGKHHPRRLPAGDQRLQRRADAAVDDRAYREPLGVNQPRTRRAGAAVRLPSLPPVSRRPDRPGSNSHRSGALHGAFCGQCRRGVRC